MNDHKKVVDFDSAKEPLLHRRRETKVKKIRNAFKAAREAVLGQSREKELPRRSGKRKKKR
jgi:hypothetical protein